MSIDEFILFNIFVMRIDCDGFVRRFYKFFTDARQKAGNAIPAGGAGNRHDGERAS